ncbi:MAG: ABC transporter ATP-binding protein [Bacteroidetes bacterium]|nr:ABC transporter ATP-binding protein [Bacteroidota bacterium]MBU1115926.1 ABC transporter ATP-binding protein [Bacteroidota bacterium]MBU1798477.1 ABC transporter ATP-binding protein [Bacteroidota bacterium]
MKLKINNLSKKYSNGIQALDNVNLEIENGMFGLLGPNGAGKSTLMRIIATLQDADSGNITFENINVLEQKNEVKKVLGYLPQEFGFYPKDKAYDLFDHFTMLKGITNKLQRKIKVEELLRKVNLWDKRNIKIGEFSGGMKQRLGIAQALLGNPKLIIVDEPTAGLDPAERNRFHNLLSEIGEDIIVILSTHIVDDVSDLCENMAIINNGKIILEAKTLDSLNSLKGKIWEKEISKHDKRSYDEQYDVLSDRLFAGKTFIRIYNDVHPNNGFLPAEVTLEDVYFFHLTDIN